VDGGITGRAAGDRRIRVLVVDDHDLFRTGLASLLAAEPDIEVVAQASGGRMGVRLAAELRPDIVLMDAKMPDMGGPEATRKILEHRPTARVLALTVSTDDADIAAAMAAGACGFLTKDTPVVSLVSAVRAAAAGAIWLSPPAAHLVLGPLRRTGDSDGANTGPSQPLSSRELDVLRLVVSGSDNTAIANALRISPRTAKNHVSNILAKLGVSNRVEAAVYAVRRHLL
jgi:DNA-binding NarL/FixJ family response regulator